MRSHTNDDAVQSVQASAYRVPTEVPEADGTIAWESTTLVLVQVQSAGATGTGWSYGSASAAAVVEQVLAPLVRARHADDVVGTHEEMRRALRNDGLPGIGATALSAVDIALWDLKARTHDLALHQLLGTCRDVLPVHGSGGSTTFDDTRTTA